MIWTVSKWVGLGFTGALGGVQAILFKLAIAALAVGITGVSGYIAGRIDCADKHHVAALRATIAEMTAREKAREAVEAEALRQKEQDERESKRVDDALERAEAIANRTVPVGQCATTDFLRQLRATR